MPNEKELLEDELLFEHHRITVDPKQSALRIDKYLLEKLPNSTRSRIQHGVKSGFIKVNDNAIKSNYKVRPNDEISISLPEPPREDEIIAEDIPLTIVYEDDDVLVVNKQAGMVVHPAHANWTGTLVNALVYHFEQLPTSQNGFGRPGLVHRIDKDTSGLLVIAKTELAMTSLAKQFFDHSVERTYHALVWRSLKEKSGTITGHVGRSLKDRRVMSVFPEGEYGKHAVTHYKLLKDLYYVNLVECKLETGRTHQIRAHFKHLGHPLFNDATYGGDKVLAGTLFTKYKQFVHNAFELMPRQALHAKTLGFKHPSSGEWMQFDSELPQDFKDVLEKWEKYGEQNS